MSRLSGLQQDVLSLYRRILREAMKKDRTELKQRSLHKFDETTDISDSNYGVQRKSFLELHRHDGEKVSAASTCPTTPLTTTAFAVIEFRKQALSVQRSDFKKIDYMIRKGDKQIKLLRMPGVKFVSNSATTISSVGAKSYNI